MEIYELFKSELNKQFQFRDYGWSMGKEISCKWIMENIIGKSILDIGGTSWLVNEINKSGRDCTYYDAFPPPKDMNVKFAVVGDMHEVAEKFPEHSFDCIILRHTLEHSLNPLFVLWQTNILLKNNGRLIVVVPHHRDYWVWYYSHFNCLPKENWRMLFYRSGFKLLREEDGYWDNEQRSPWFVENRFVLQQECRQIRLDEEKIKQV